MISGLLSTQNTKHNIISKDHKKVSANESLQIHIYYAHPIGTYYTAIENKDLAFLKNKGIITNPRDLNIGSDMFCYLKVVKRNDMVYYRGQTIGVVLEILSALAFGKKVYSIETRKSISKREKDLFVQILNSSIHRESDIYQFKYYFPDDFNNFIKLIGVE